MEIGFINLENLPKSNVKTCILNLQLYFRPGGIYNKDGLKHGKWIDLWHAFDWLSLYLIQ